MCVYVCMYTERERERDSARIKPPQDSTTHTYIHTIYTHRLYLYHATTNSNSKLSSTQTYIHTYIHTIYTHRLGLYHATTNSNSKFSTSHTYIHTYIHTIYTHRLCSYHATMNSNSKFWMFWASLACMMSVPYLRKKATASRHCWVCMHAYVCMCAFTIVCMCVTSLRMYACVHLLLYVSV
jgi:hypothetical protein